MVVTDKAKFNHCMELVEESVTEEQLASLSANNLSELELKEISEAIEKQCMSKANHFEGKDPDAIGSRSKGTYLALGARVAAIHCKDCDRRDPESAGTPPDTRPIRNHFALPR